MTKEEITIFKTKYREFIKKVKDIYEFYYISQHGPVSFIPPISDFGVDILEETGELNFYIVTFSGLYYKIPDEYFSLERDEWEKLVLERIELNGEL